MPNVVLGNEHVIESVKIDEQGDASPGNLRVVDRKDLGNQITTISLPETHEVSFKPIAEHREATKTQAGVRADPDRAGYYLQTMWPLGEQMAAVRTHVGMHFADRPTWVESDDLLIAELIAREYDCRVGRPKSWRTG
jgi:hypothetical protein